MLSRDWGRTNELQEIWSRILALFKALKPGQLIHSNESSDKCFAFADQVLDILSMYSVISLIKMRTSK